MIKSQEVSDTSSCLNRARHDEMLFVLLGRDVAAPETIRFWARRRVELGKNRISDPQILEALAAAEMMERGVTPS
jgi:hypothetical protein